MQFEKNYMSREASGILYHLFSLTNLLLGGKKKTSSILTQSDMFSSYIYIYIFVCATSNNELP